MLDNVIYLAIIACGAGLVLCIASIVYQTWLKAREQREIRARLDAQKREELRHLADLRAANCDRCDGLARCETCRYGR